jgi:hypothetical protein
MNNEQSTIELAQITQVYNPLGWHQVTRAVIHNNTKTINIEIWEEVVCSFTKVTSQVLTQHLHRFIPQTPGKGKSLFQ